MNDTPTIELPDGFTFAEDGSLVKDFTSYIGDIDGDDLTLSASENENITVSIEGFSVTFCTVQDSNGTEVITFSVDDSQGRLVASDSLSITVTPVNDAPVLTVPEAQSTAEDTPLTITLSATDVENNSLTYSAVSDISDVSVSVSGDQLTMTPALNYHGAANITVTVGDGFLTDEGSFGLTVTPMNDPPVATNVSVSPAIPEDEDDLTLNYNYVDVDGDIESGTTITWYRNEEEQSQFANEITIPNDATFCFDIWYAEVVPFDGIASVDTTISNYVDICSANTPPAWADIQDQHINEDSGENILSMVGLITDESIVDLEFNVVLNSDTTNLSANFDGTDLVLIPRIENYNSTTPVEMILSASDGQYLRYTDYIYIFIDPLNDPPVLNAIADQNTNEDTQLTMNLSGVDVDGDNLSFSAASGDTSLVNVLVFAS